MRPGDIVLTPLPQADGNTKFRPALLLKRMPPFDDLLVCGISTQLHREFKGFDEVILEEASDFRSCGLKASSLIRLGFLAVLPAAQIRGAIGRISDERLARLRQRLSEFILARD